MAGSGSKLAVYSAIAANSTVMVAKFIGWGLTGSGAMLSEGIHSFADVGNQVLLAVGMGKSQRKPDKLHPFGYGREAFVWALMSAVGIFFLGCGVTVMHGLESLFGHGEHAVEASNVAIGILLFSLVIESITLGIAVRAMWNEAKSRGVGFVANLRTTDDPFGIAVLLEDSAAVLGVLFALVAIGVSEATGDHRWDAYGTLAIGLLLGAVALFLIRLNRTLLLGRAVNPEDQQALRTLLETDPAIERVAIQRATVAGTDDYRISAEIDFDGAWIAKQWLEDKSLADLRARLGDDAGLEAFLKEYGEAVITQTGVEIDRIEAKIRHRLPKARNVALEPHA